MMDLEIINDHKDYIVVNKHAGLISEKNPFEAITVEDQVSQHLLKSNPKPYVGVIHRLDRVTSGVMVFAKKKSVLVAFNNLFSSREVQKTYLAIVTTKPQKTKAILTNFLVKNNLDKRADIVATRTKDSQSCSLTYQVIGENRFGYLLEVKPKTGRFHQIRAQLAHIGLPIIGDEKYGSEVTYVPLSICLHAWKLNYQDPKTNELMSFEATLPKHEVWGFESL